LTDGTEVDIEEGGSNRELTYENRIEYAKKVLATRLKEFQIQVTSIKRGICSIVPEALLNMVSYKEIEEFIYGSKHIDVDLLKRNTKYADCYKDESMPQIDWFWKLMKSMSQE
jgi:E3 ubiquitin-protein ligase HECTD3